jgi:glycosyltransferase involved in cell wall biosynthesis
MITRAAGVDRDSPARVTYWTGTWDPRKEAISKEIGHLRVADRSRALVVAFSARQPLRFRRRERVLTFGHRHWPVLRALAPLLERAGDVTHVFGGAESWHLIRSIGRRPIVLTAVVHAKPGDRLPHARFARVVVEADALIEEWATRGVPRTALTVVYPGIDLDRYAFAPRQRTERLRLLFASSPSEPSEIDARGIPLLIELARVRHDIEIVVPWRLWGDVDGAAAVLDGLRPPPNFHVCREHDVDMRRYFAQADATIVCFRAGVGKVLPNFVLEGLAVGRPCLATRESGLASLLETSGAGVVCERSVASLAAAVDILRASLDERAVRARELAERLFDLRAFRAAYESIYRDVSCAFRAESPWTHRP